MEWQFKKNGLHLWLKMKVLYSIGLLLTVALFLGCTSSADNAEGAAQLMLAQAREQLASKDYDGARTTILALRKEHPTALKTRRAAILTLDSVELLATRDSVARYEQMLDAAREDFKQMLPRENGQTNQAYYAQQRVVMEMERHFDELC